MDISGRVRKWARETPDKLALRFEGTDLSYRDLDSRIGAVTRMLAGELGVRHGDRIAFLGFNSTDFLVMVFACARLGAMMVPLNWRLAGPEILYILRDSDAAALFVEPEFEKVASSIEGGLPDCRRVNMTGAPGEADDFETLIALAGDADPDTAGDENNPLLIVYTSGTTGRPKGAVLTQRAMVANAENSIAAHRLTADDVVLTNLPMFHVGGMNIQTTPALYAGATVVLQRRFEPDPTIAAIRDFRPTLLVMVPALMQALMDHPDWDGLDLSAVRCIDTGSTTVPVPLLRAFLALNIPVIQIYGLTETAPIVIHQLIDDAFETAGSVGVPAKLCDAKICDLEGNELGDDEKGEIVVRGPNIMREYWRNPEATAEVLSADGWFRTGDIGHRDSSGNYYVDDRTKDVIISGSENIYPAEVELVLDECAEIAEAAVVGRPDEKWGEVPVACVVRKRDSTITREQVLALYQNRLARFKHPHDVLFMEALPRNVMGKVLKYELRETIRGEG